MPVKFNLNHTGFRFSPLFSIALLCAVIGLGLVACGSNGGTGTGSGSGATPTPTTATIQKCGTVHTLPNGKLTDGTAAKSAENCFWQAYQKCQPATLIYSAGGVDTISTSAFTITSKTGQCSIIDASQFSIAPATPSAPKTYTCAGMTQQQDGLHIASCGSKGNVIIPAPTGM